MPNGYENGNRSRAGGDKLTADARPTAQGGVRWTRGGGGVVAVGCRVARVGPPRGPVLSRSERGICRGFPFCHGGQGGARRRRYSCRTPGGGVELPVRARKRTGDAASR